MRGFTQANRHPWEIASVARLVLSSAVRFGFAVLAAVFSGLFVPSSLADEVVRILAGNISSGNNQSYDEGPGNRILQGLKPDVALLQELNVGNNTAAEYRTWVNTNFGATFSYFCESGKNIPNGIVSRYPILSSGVWDDTQLTDREFVWARIDIPGDKNLWAISVHLKASKDSSSTRNTQATNLKAYIQSQVPAADYVVIGGDFNTYSRTEACLTTLSSIMVTTAPWPADQAGNTNTNASQGSPYDWVMPSSSLAARAAPLVIGSHAFTNGLVFDSRDYTPLSDVSPVISTDSGATNMQHMAVMRAFLMPTNEPPVIAQGTSVAVTLSKNNTPTAFSRSLSATDANGDTLTWSISSAAAHGTAGVVSPVTGGTVNLSYTPVTNYTGTDSFIVQVSDGKGGTDTITVNLTIQPPPNTPPVIAGNATVPVTLSKNNTPIAFSLSLAATDADSDPLTWSISTAAAHGTAGIAAPASGGSAALTYQPATNYTGTDSFVVQVSDGQGGIDAVTVNLTIEEPPNVVPVIAGPELVAVSLSRNNFPNAFALSLSATDADSDPLTWSIASPAAHGTAGIVAPATGGSITLSYLPVGNYIGPDSFTVQVADGRGGMDTVMVNLTVEAVAALDAWTFDHFPTLTPETKDTVWGDDADPDGDGYSNLAEFANGLDPLVSDSAPNLLGVSLDTGEEGQFVLLAFKIRMDGDSPALNYAVQSSPGLEPGAWSDLAASSFTVEGETEAVDGFKVRTIRLSGAIDVGANFFRLKMTR